MNILSFAFTIAFMVYLFFGFYVINLLMKTKTNRSLYAEFFVLCIVFSFWSFNHIFLVSSGNVSGCWFWYRMSVPPLVFFPALILNFFLILTKNVTGFPRAVYYAVYLPGVVFMFKAYTGIFTISGFIKKSYGWELIHAVDSPWYTAYTAYYIIMTTSCLVLTGWWYYKTGSLREKNQAILIFISAMLTLLTNLIVQTILPLMNIYSFPQIGQILILIWILGIWYSMVKYRFMAVEEIITINEIVTHIREMIIVLSPDLKVIGINGNFREFFWGGSHGSGSLTELSREESSLSFYDLAEAGDDLKNNFAALTGRVKNSFRSRIYFKKEPPVLIDSNFSCITDVHSDLKGILVIARVNKGREYMQAMYKITCRQFEIIDLCIAGDSNREIAERLGLSEKTVETHLNNIYNKLAVDNRIELLNIAYEFNLVHKD